MNPLAWPLDESTFESPLASLATQDSTAVPVTGNFLVSYDFRVVNYYHNMLSRLPTRSVTSKKSPNVFKSCPKMISLEKLRILITLQKLPKNVGDLG